jgi:trk system potassium uptake protein TrkA
MHIIIVGCGRVGARLAQLLAEEKHDVVVIDKKKEAFEKLGQSFNGLTIRGVGFDLETLEKAGIEKADVFLAVTNGDNSNIVSSQVAKKIFGVPRVIARVYDPQRARIYAHHGFEIISQTAIGAATIKNLVLGETLISHFPVGEGARILELAANKENFGKCVLALNIPGELQVIAVVRNNKTLLPKDDVFLLSGDQIVCLVLNRCFDQVKKTFSCQLEKEEI